MQSDSWCHLPKHTLFRHGVQSVTDELDVKSHRDRAAVNHIQGQHVFIF